MQRETREGIPCQSRSFARGAPPTAWGRAGSHLLTWVPAIVFLLGAAGFSACSAPPTAASHGLRSARSPSPAQIPLDSQPATLTSPESQNALLLGADDRFRFVLDWTSGQSSGTGGALEHTPDSGFFYTRSETKLEMLVKVIDGRALNGHFWVFYGAATDVAFELTVEDTQTGAERTYTKVKGRFGSHSDTRAFADADGAFLQPSGSNSQPPSLAHPPATSSCADGGTELCLGEEDRFRVTLDCGSRGRGGEGRSIEYSDDSGIFYFSGNSNLEVLVVILDGRRINGHFWVFYGAATDVAFELSVTDTLSGIEKIYGKEQGESTSFGDTSAFSSRPPNIVLLLVDDLGYADLGVQGSTDVRTPRIDSLADQGARFTSGYVTAPVCSPSRAALITGRYQQRFGHEINPGRQRYLEGAGLPVGERTFADRLHGAGYTTGAIGKWDLGFDPQYHPLSRGFDEFYGFLTGSRTYFPEEGRPWHVALTRGWDPIPEELYMTDALALEASAFIDRYRDEPFFLYVSFNAPHWPMEAKEEHLALFEHVPDLQRRTLLAMLTALDEGVGTILDALRDNGLDENTLVFFVSDNGGKPGERSSPDAPFVIGTNASSNAPLRGGKGELFDGGIRVPFLLRWPARIPSGLVFDFPVSSLDLLPTAMAAAFIDPEMHEELDGVNLLPFLTGENQNVPHDALYWRVKGRKAVRDGRWKLIRHQAGVYELYDLEVDPSEESDLRDEFPEEAARLRGLLQEWEAELVPPLW
jgi:arylsulfatase A-like enzyme